MSKKNLFDLNDLTSIQRMIIAHALSILKRISFNELMQTNFKLNHQKELSDFKKKKLKDQLKAWTLYLDITEKTMPMIRDSVTDENVDQDNIALKLFEELGIYPDILKEDQDKPDLPSE